MTPASASRLADSSALSSVTRSTRSSGCTQVRVHQASEARVDRIYWPDIRDLASCVQISGIWHVVSRYPVFDR